MITDEIIHTVSLYPVLNEWINGKSNGYSFARHYTPNEKKDYSEIKTYLQGISEMIYQTGICSDELYIYYFAHKLIKTILLERICLECRLNNKRRIEIGLPKIRISKRCKLYKEYSCKMAYIVHKMLEMLNENNLII